MRISDWSSDVCSSDLTLQLGASNRIRDTSDLVINGGMFDLNNFKETVANLSGTGGNINIGAGGTGALTVNQTVDQTYTGNFSGARGTLQAAIVKNGARSEERRVGKESVSTYRSGWGPCEY